MVVYDDNIKNMNLWEKVSQISSEVEYLQKDDKVGYGSNSYKAISIEKVMSAVAEKMSKYGVVIYPIEQDYKRTDETVINLKGEQKINRVSDVNVKYEIVNIHNSSEKIHTVSSGTGVDTQDKGIGKAMTYAYKNMIIKLFAIATGDDTDKVHSDDYTNKLMGATGENKENKNAADLTEAQIKRLYAIAHKVNVTPVQIVGVIKKEFNKTDVAKLNKAEYDIICKRLESKVE